MNSKLFSCIYLALFIWFSPLKAQHKTYDFIKCDASIAFDVSQKRVLGEVTYEFNASKQTDTVKIDAVQISFKDVKINNKRVNFLNNNKQLLLYEGFKKGKNVLTFEYEAFPKQALYFIDLKNNSQIWTQGQGKDNSHWLPSFNDLNEKLVFNLDITFDKDFTVISNGILEKTTLIPNSHLKRWYFKMQSPMSSYLVMLAIGKFEKFESTTSSGTPIAFYIDTEDVDKVEPTYRYSKQIFDFFEKKLGIKYPWKIYKQVPVEDFLYGGMENTTATIFAKEFVVDSIGFNDRTYVNVNAHELAHQWFGNLVTAKESKHHWLHEGFATYYALLAEKELFGEDHFYWALYEMAERIQKSSVTDTIPLLNKKASSLTFYQKGAWALFDLNQQIGDKAFDKAVHNYLKKYAFKTVETQDFLDEVKKTTSFDDKLFYDKWLLNKGFPIANAIAQLLKNKHLEAYFKLIEQQEHTFASKQELFENILKSDHYYALKEEVVYQLAEEEFESIKSLLAIAKNNNHPKINQAIARILNPIPEEYRTDYESFLQEKSYITLEIALGALWSQFPEHQHNYLNTTRNIEGFQDKNIRILWLTLALMTKDYALDNKPIYYDELLSYASPDYSSFIRQNAITNLLYLNPNDLNIMRHLIQATTHHRWQFTMFARNQIRALMKSEQHQNYFKTILPELNEKEKFQLEKLFP